MYNTIKQFGWKEAVARTKKVDTGSPDFQYLSAQYLSGGNCDSSRKTLLFWIMFFKSDSNRISHTIFFLRMTSSTIWRIWMLQARNKTESTLSAHTWAPTHVSSSKAWACRLCSNFPQQTLSKAWPCRVGRHPPTALGDVLKIHDELIHFDELIQTL